MGSENLSEPAAGGFAFNTVGTIGFLETIYVFRTQSEVAALKKAITVDGCPGRK